MPYPPLLVRTCSWAHTTGVIPHPQAELHISTYDYCMDSSLFDSNKRERERGGRGEGGGGESKQIDAMVMNIYHFQN